MSTRYAIFCIAALSALSVCACAQAPDKALSRKQPSAASAAQDSITLENLLLWPLDEPQGTKRVTASLQRIFTMEPLQGPQLYGKGPVHLSDGHILSFAWIRQRTNSIDIGVADKPCLPVERAVSITRAIVEPTVIDQHGADRGAKYQAERNGFSVRFETTPNDRRCVTDIHISPSQR
jgi:hypothetical protein